MLRHDARPRARCALLAVTVTLSAAPASAAPTWLPDEPLGTGSGATVAFDASGAATVVWSDGTTGIRASRRAPGDAFSVGALISRGTTAVGAPSVAVSPGGTAVAAWAQKDAADAWVVQAAMRSTAGTWTAPEPLSGSSATPPDPVAAIDASGGAIVIWRRAEITVLLAQVAERAPGGVWSAPTNVSSGGPVTDVDVVLDANGNATAMWQQSNAVMTAERPANGLWTTPRALTPGSSLSRPDLAIGPAGHLAVIFNIDPVQGVAARFRSPAGAWSDNERVGAASPYMDSPAIALDAAGAATAAWSNGSSISVNHRPVGGAWSAPETVLSAGVFPDAYDARVAVGAHGLAVASWYGSGMDGAHHSQAALYWPGQTWGVAQDFGQGNAPAGAVDDQDNVLTVRPSGTGTVTARVYDVGGPDLLELTVPPTAEPGQALEFRVAPRDRWSPITPPRWDFGDGVAATGTAVTHSFAASGDYTVSVSAADVLGNTTSAARTVTVRAPATAPLPTPAPPSPVRALTVEGATLPVSFRRSRVTGHVKVRVRGHVSDAAGVAVTLVGPLRPAAKRGTLALGAANLPAGPFAFELPVAAKQAAKLIPGTYDLLLRGTDLAAATRVTVPAPPEGVVMDARMSTTRTGPSLLRVTRAKQLWATFRFAPDGETARRLRATWYKPGRARPVGTFPVKGPRAYSFWRAAGGLRKGVWKCELRAGRTVVSSVSIRVG